MGDTGRVLEPQLKRRRLPMGLSIRSSHVGFFAIGVGLLAAPANAQQSLTVATYGGEWGDALQSCILEPFAKANNIKVTPEPGVSTVTLAKLRQQKGNPSIDVAWIDGGVSELAAADDLVATLTEKAVPGLANMIPEGIYKKSTGDIYALSTGFYALGLVYNTKEVKTPPSSWWDLAKPEFEGASTVPSPANAMGVPLFLHINKLAGGTPGNYEPAVKKYKELRVSSFFDSSGAATNSFQSGEVIVGGHYASAAWSLADKGLPITYVAPKEGAPSGDIRVHVVNGTRNRAAAEKFIDFAVAKEQASCLSEKLYTGPATKGVSLSEKAQQRMPWGKGGTVANLALTNWVDLNAQRQAVTDVWNREVARR
jgi:putative spermidine/putrescine transport system substrate-binding protein